LYILESDNIIFVYVSTLSIHFSINIENSAPKALLFELALKTDALLQYFVYIRSCILQ